LFWLLMRAAAARTFWTAGRSSPIRTAMIAITTNNSISVKPRRECGGEEKDNTIRPFKNENETDYDSAG
jgi:hypothetical protein